MLLFPNLAGTRRQADTYYLGNQLLKFVAFFEHHCTNTAFVSCDLSALGRSLERSPESRELCTAAGWGGELTACCLTSHGEVPGSPVVSRPSHPDALLILP